MKSKFNVVILLLGSLGLLFWITYKPKLITPNAKQENFEKFPNSSQSVRTEVGIQNTVEKYTPDQSMNTNSADEKSYIDDAILIQIAHERAKQGAEIPEGLVPKIKYRGDLAEIIWPIESSPDTIIPRGDYYALVEINRKTGAIIKTLASP